MKTITLFVLLRFFDGGTAPLNIATIFLSQAECEQAMSRADYNSGFCFKMTAEMSEKHPLDEKSRALFDRFTGDKQPSQLIDRIR